MSLAVYPPALRAYAAQFSDDQEAAQAARSYVGQHGSFSAHESGLMGQVLPLHRDLVAKLDGLLSHLADVLGASQAASDKAAAYYEKADRGAASAADAAYPAVVRPTPTRD